MTDHIDNTLHLFDLTANLLHLTYSSFYALHCEFDFPLTSGVC